MLKIPLTPFAQSEMGKRSRRFEAMRDNEAPCLICGKPVRIDKTYTGARTFWGSHFVTEAEAADIIAKQGTGGDMGLYPVGRECARMFPEVKPYLVKVCKNKA